MVVTAPNAGKALVRVLHEGPFFDVLAGAGEVSEGKTAVSRRNQEAEFLMPRSMVTWPCVGGVCTKSAVAVWQMVVRAE